MFKYADYIYEIYKQGSFTKAAKKLYISQPSISAMVKKAERQLGFSIFIKGTAELTEEGSLYIAAIEEMWRLEDDLKNHVESIRNLNFGNITVSGAAFISSFILPKIIMEFAKKYPQIKINIFESNSIKLQEKLLNEEVDTLIDYDFDEKLFDAFPIKKENILLAVPKGFPVNEKLKDKALNESELHLLNAAEDKASLVSLSDFGKERFILLKQGNNMRKVSCKICEEYGMTPHVVVEVDQLLTAFNMAMAGMGITFVTDTLANATVKNDKLYFYRIKSEHSQRTLYIANKKKKYVRPVVSEFVKVARQIYGF